MSLITAEFDMSGLREQVRRAFLASTKTLPEVLNQKALNVAGRAFNNTPIASKQRILYELGEIGRAVRRGKNGKTVRGARRFVRAFGNSGASRAALIVNARRARKGLPGLEGKAMEKAIVKMLGTRKRSVGFEKSAYFPALKDFAAALPRPFKIAKTAGIAVYGRAKGEGKAARSGSWSPSATIINSAKGIVKVGSKGMQDAINEESSEIQRHLADDIKPIVEAFNSAGH